MLDYGFGELLLMNKPETGLKFFTFTWCLLPLQCGIKALFPLQLFITVLQSLHNALCLSGPFFNYTLNSSSLDQLLLKTLFPCTLVPFLLNIFTILKRKGN